MKINTTTILLPITIFFMVVLFIFQIYAQYFINHANEQHLKSITISNHLKQTSDDLTRMVRTYVITQKPIYKSHFDEILAIRDGLSPRPEKMNTIYWDLVGDDNTRPIAFKEPIPLSDIMAETGFTQNELRLLEKTKKNSDYLATIETRAMSIIEKDNFTSEQHMQAINMLHNDVYHQHKLNIMTPIANFQKTVANRTLDKINDAKQLASLSFIFLTLTILLTIYQLYKLVQEKRNEAERLTQSVDKRTHDLLLAKQQAENANQVKSEFLSSMSHELRTPMNAVIGFTQLMQMDDDLSADQKENLSQIHASSNHLLGLIEDVLDLAKIESGNNDLHLTETEVKPVIDEALSMIQHASNKQNIMIDSMITSSQTMTTDKNKLKQILINLLSNAVKYNQPNGFIHIYAYTQNQSLIIDIKNTGKGIAKKDLKSLFQPFNRLGYENSNIVGTGVGLVITKNLVELLGGHIKVKSEINQHTTFSITLPTHLKTKD